MNKNFNPSVSVIIPAYNAGDMLHIALDSLMKQSYKRLEIILINDCSTDNTRSVIEDFVPGFKERGIVTKLISHRQNRGIAAARNTGLEYAEGEYIYYVDADDWIEPDAIELLVREAVSKDADIVGCSWFLSFERNERKMKQASFADPAEAIKNMLNGTMRWNLWLFMVRRSLYEKDQTRFISGMDMGEDLRVIIILFIRASRVSYLDKALYHYGQSNDQSLTKIYSDAHIREVTANVKEVEQCLSESRFAPHLRDSLCFLKLNIKLPLLISDRDEQYRAWLAWFPEVNNKVMDNGALPFRTRLLQWLAVKEQFWAVKLYYHGMIRFVYGKIYR